FLRCLSASSLPCSQPFLILLRPPPRSTLFPYTTLFRSIVYKYHEKSGDDLLLGIPIQILRFFPHLRVSLQRFLQRSRIQYKQDGDENALLLLSVDHSEKHRRRN